MPLMSKQAIIVLREELEYFSIPTKGTAAAKAATRDTLVHGKGLEEVAANNVTTHALLKLKQQSGAALLERKQIFTALQRNVNKENNMAEQHLIDMLCMR
jgi:methyl coenzyme M reductase gamma subunit